MKKRLILGMAALAAVTLTSCQKDQVINQVPQEQAIEFNTYLGRDAQTKGKITTTESIKTSGFGVYAYYTGEETYATKYASSSSSTTVFNPNFMSNQKVTYTSPNWVYNPIKYWPNTDNHKVSFIAYAPHYALNNATVELSLDSDKGTPKITYKIPEDQTSHEDLVVAPLKNDLTKETGSVSLRFFHALSRIGFKVKSDGDYSSNAKITLKSITLSGPFYTEGVLELYETDGDIQVPSTNAYWDLDDNKKATSPSFRSYTVTKDVEVTNVLKSVSEPASDKKNESNYIMVIPQNFSGTPETDKISIKVVYDVEYKIAADAGSMDGKITNTVTKTTPVTFQPGKAYTFNLSIGMTGVTFSDIVVESWPEPENINVGSF